MAGKALVVNRWWAGIFATLMTVVIVGGFNFYVETKTALASAIVESESVQQQFADLKRTVRSMDKKLDKLLERSSR